jgi:hypothetical protein
MMADTRRHLSRTWLFDYSSIRRGAVKMCVEGARLIQAEGLESKSAPDLAAPLSEALTEGYTGLKPLWIDLFDAIREVGNDLPR